MGGGVSEFRASGLGYQDVRCLGFRDWDSGSRLGFKGSGCRRLSQRKVY